jgi:hypothetical protein
MAIQNDPVLFSKEQISKIEDLRKAKYVCASEHKDMCVEVFYGDDAHPVSGSRYFALYKTTRTNELMITDGSFIEDQEINAVIADNGDIVYSRYRHDYRKSNDNSVWIDGGRAYTRSGLYSKDKQCMLEVRNGSLQVKN